MADPSKGRGRGLALFKMLQTPTEPEKTTAPPSAAGEPSTASGIGGRGRIAMMMMQQKPGGPIFAPASDVRPPTNTAIGTGRGKLLQSLSALASTQPKPVVESDVSQVSQQLAETKITSRVPKNKPFTEVKATAPIVMKGETGTPCEVTSNFISLRFEENSVFEYDVRFEPDVDYKSLRFRLLNEHSNIFKTKSFDGTTLYLPHELPDEATTLISTNPFDESKVKINITFRRRRQLSEMIHIYNVLFKQIMNDLKLVRFGRQHFNEHAAKVIPQHKLEVWPGYVTAVDEYEGGLMLTLDSTHRVLRTENVLTLIKDMVQRSGAGWKQAASDILIGCSVMTSYNKKLFRVDDIDDTLTPQSTFEKNEGGTVVKISYIDYYKKNYGIDIMDWDQPMLISRASKLLPGDETKTEFILCLVPELCQLTGLTEDQRSDFRLMKDVATYTRITPNQRHAAFKQYINNVMSNEKAKERLAGWGLSIAPETINLTARTLPPEPLYFGNGVKIPGKPNADWNMDATKNQMMSVFDLERWVVFYSKRDEQVTRGFVDTAMRCGRPMGMTILKPQMVMLPSDRTDAYVSAIKQHISSHLQMVVAICPTARDDRYSAIKKLCCAECPVPSQVINSRTIKNEQKLRSITQKILLQLNCKLGGTLWHIAIPLKTAMVVGIDSYHEASRKSRSVCAFVASYDQTMTRWYSRVIFQQCGQEIVDGLKSCLVDALKHYLHTNGKLPDRIIIYRDGVGDGQLRSVQKYEIPQMQVCFTTMDSVYQPTLTYVVVQKRINSRVFMKTREGHENPPPGTVLDHSVTRRDWYDFLIVSQKVNQGTVTPSHYIVVHDDSGMSPDQCQRLTYKLTHLYYNWPGTVRVPAPCQYAHKLAYLVGQSIHQRPAEELVDKLFFL